MDNLAEGALYRIAQGVVDPKLAARIALEKMGAETPPGDVVDEIRVTRWEDGDISVTYDKGEMGHSETASSKASVLAKVYEFLDDS